MQGIMFREELFRAILEGRKTQTRRIGSLSVINDEPDSFKFWHLDKDPEVLKLNHDGEIKGDRFGEPLMNKIKGHYGLFEGPFPGDCESRYFRPKYQPGEIVYLKESYGMHRIYHTKGDDGKIIPPTETVIYALDTKPLVRKHLLWKNKMFMPGKHARYFIKITNVRVERLQDISVDDIITEGVKPEKDKHRGTPFIDGMLAGAELRDKYQNLWESINGKDSWDANPWVWVYSFEHVILPHEYNWLVYERDREYARENIDKPICEVRAASKEIAEEKAMKNYVFMTGPWAVKEREYK